MSVRVIWTCDGCFNEAERTVERSEGGYKYPTGWRGVAGNLLCGDCQDSFFEWLESRRSEPVPA